MTVASEISRLQTAKACLKASIESKGVSVPSNLTLEDYYACIDEIQTGGGGLPGFYGLDYIVVGGGGSGAGAGFGGGGGGGAVCIGIGCVLRGDCYQVIIGNGGASNNKAQGCDGGNSCIYSSYQSIIAQGGKGGCGVTCGKWCCCEGGGRSGSGCHGGNNDGCAAGGGGGAYNYGCNATYYNGGNGGAGICGYGGGGGGFARSGTRGTGVDGGGNGGNNGTGSAATNCGGGGGGGGYNGSSQQYSGAGAKGIVKICYLADGSCGFTTATGGNSCCLDNGYCIHEFTSNGTFCIVS